MTKGPGGDRLAVLAEGHISFYVVPLPVARSVRPSPPEDHHRDQSVRGILFVGAVRTIEDGIHEFIDLVREEGNVTG
jgi:hypothetical protein